jgi:integrase
VNKLASIRKRGDSWYYTINLGFDPATGKRRQLVRSGFHTRREAEAESRKAELERDTGFDLRPDRLTVRDYLKRWLFQHGKAKLAASTHRRYEQLIRCHIVPSLGNLGLRKVRPADVRRFHDAVLATGCSSTTLLQAHNILHEALRHAVHQGLLGRNVLDMVERPRPARFEAPTLSVDDLRRIMATADALGIGPLVRFAVHTGMRQAEMFTLRWQDLDLGVGVVFIRHSKTRSGVRAVALSGDLVTFIQEHKLRLLREAYETPDLPRDPNAVFPWRDGQAMTQGKLRKPWEKLRRTLAMPELRFHDLRHGHATALVQIGVSPRVAQERLGHASALFTMQVYSHVSAESQRQAAEALAQLLDEHGDQKVITAHLPS